MTHDLQNLLAQTTSKLASEYQRMSEHVSDDPGTAGDQGESNWERVLREWLPAHFHVTTKGRVVSASGSKSMQVDVVVLSPNYPQGLLDSKHYVASGVFAAFECKRNLRAEGIKRAFEQSARVKNTAFPVQEATAFNAICAFPIYGVLAHSCDIPGSDHSSKVRKVAEIIEKARVQTDLHPRELPDFFCIANLGCWFIHKIFIQAGKPGQAVSPFNPRGDFELGVGYLSPGGDRQNPDFTPIGSFLTKFYMSLAWKHRELRDIANYFSAAGVTGGSSGKLNVVPRKKIPDWVWTHLRLHGVSTKPYDEWGMVFD